MLISSSYHTHTIARLQHLLRALGREGEESERVTDGTPREQIDEGETRRVLGGGDEGRLLRARVTGVEVRLTVLRRQTNTLNLRALVRQEDVSPERQRQRVGRADGDVDVVERARGDARAALRRARLLRHAAVIHTRKQKTHARSVSLSPSHPRPIISRSSPDRVIDPSWIRHPSIRAHHHPPRVARLSSLFPSRVREHRALVVISRVPLKRGDGASGNGRSREHDE